MEIDTEKPNTEYEGEGQKVSLLRGYCVFSGEQKSYYRLLLNEVDRKLRFHELVTHYTR